MLGINLHHCRGLVDMHTGLANFPLGPG